MSERIVSDGRTASSCPHPSKTDFWNIIPQQRTRRALWGFSDEVVATIEHELKSFGCPRLKAQFFADTLAYN